jgi:SAM-dependent methyltransferase
MIDDFLYNNPDLYEQVFPPRGKSDLCVRVIQEFLTRAPTSVLDIGCGTGRDLAGLANFYPNCVGFDVSPAMINFAQQRYPAIEFYVGDMRSYRLSRSFDVILAMGGCINFALSDEDIEATVSTFADHSHDGTLLFLQPMNPGDYFGKLNVPATFSVTFRGALATATAEYEVGELTQTIHRMRTWSVEGTQIEFTDSMSYRIFFLGEIIHLLKSKGFNLLRVFCGAGSAAYANQSMYIVAKYTAK